MANSINGQVQFKHNRFVIESMTFNILYLWRLINSLELSDAILRHSSGSTLELWLR